MNGPPAGDGDGGHDETTIALWDTLYEYTNVVDSGKGVEVKEVRPCQPIVGALIAAFHLASINLVGRKEYDGDFRNHPDLTRLRDLLLAHERMASDPPYRTITEIMRTGEGLLTQLGRRSFDKVQYMTGVVITAHISSILRLYGTTIVPDTSKGGAHGWRETTSSRGEGTLDVPLPPELGGPAKLLVRNLQRLHGISVLASRFAMLDRPKVPFNLAELIATIADRRSMHKPELADKMMEWARWAIDAIESVRTDIGEGPLPASTIALWTRVIERAAVPPGHPDCFTQSKQSKNSSSTRYLSKCAAGSSKITGGWEDTPYSAMLKDLDAQFGHQTRIGDEFDKFLRDGLTWSPPSASASEDDAAASGEGSGSDGAPAIPPLNFQTVNGTWARKFPLHHLGEPPPGEKYERFRGAGRYIIIIIDYCNILSNYLFTHRIYQLYSMITTGYCNSQVRGSPSPHLTSSHPSSHPLTLTPSLPSSSRKVCCRPDIESPNKRSHCRSSARPSAQAQFARSGSASIWQPWPTEVSPSPPSPTCWMA